ncbi:hypothetical protein A7J05_16170 [Streptomyces alfalfae]|uniref:Uncharacterized protein n=1 Tax=Streptomyces alfalfae TaxID=1642299 RepID=A0ABM6GUA8_9ACTN|nr:hypothetical protein A7J05_16170 [Streptomyces alfalfae]
MGAGRGDDGALRRRRYGPAREAGAYGFLGEGAAAVEQGGGRGVAAQGAERGEVVGARPVAGAEDVGEERQVAGGGAG